MPEEYSGPAPARIIRGLKNEQIRENDLIVLKALISGNPMPNVNSSIISRFEKIKLKYF